MEVNQVISHSLKQNKTEQIYSGHGKVLLSGEYFILDGAKGLALPTNLGQTMKVRYESSYDPKLIWKSYDVEGNLWYEAQFELWHFNSLSNNHDVATSWLQKILKQARKQNKHFLREEKDVTVETYLDFPTFWGLGSSSTLIYNIAQWAYVGPFTLQSKTFGGSGYDIACAQSEGPILYKKKTTRPAWSTVYFDPSFKNQLYFVYLGRKQDSREGIDLYKEKKESFGPEVYQQISNITDKMLNCSKLDVFEELIEEHEKFVSSFLGLRPIKEERYVDYWGAIKSLGAWGGDFVLVTSDRGLQDTKNYFSSKGLDVFIAYDDLILNNRNQFISNLNTQLSEDQANELIQ